VLVGDGVGRGVVPAGACVANGVTALDGPTGEGVVTGPDTGSMGDGVVTGSGAG